MAAAWSRKRPLAKNVVDSIAIGDKVRRHFSTHELQAGTPTSQCVDGIVTGSQTGRGRGKKSKEIWWSVRFDAPVPYPLLCSTNDVAEMKICFHEHRDKWAALDKDIGKELTVGWTEEDQATSMNGSQMTLRNCILMQYLTSSQRYLLRNRCGYEKTIQREDLVLLWGESGLHRASRTKRKRDQVALADDEEFTLANVLPSCNTEVQLISEPEGNVTPQLAEVGGTRTDELLQKNKSVADKALQHRESVLQMQLEESRAHQQADLAWEQNPHMAEEQEALV